MVTLVITYPKKRGRERELFFSLGELFSALGMGESGGYKQFGAEGVVIWGPIEVRMLESKY